MGILKNHIKKEIRWESGDLKLYNPTEIQEDEIMNIIKGNSNINLDKGEVNAEYGMAMIRYFLKELTSIGNEIDEYDDAELTVILDSGDFALRKLMSEIEILIKEMTEEFIDSQIAQIKLMNSMLKIAEIGQDSKETKTRLDKMLKKQGLNLTVNDFIENKDNPEKIQELIKNSKKKNNKKASKK